jgi:hypothetical protein
MQPADPLSSRLDELATRAQAARAAPEAQTTRWLDASQAIPPVPRTRHVAGLHGARPAPSILRESALAIRRHGGDPPVQQQSRSRSRPAPPPLRGLRARHPATGSAARSDAAGHPLAARTGVGAFLSLCHVKRAAHRLAQAASRRRAFCTDGSAPFARASGRARKSTLAGLAAIVISSPVAGLRPWRAFCAGLTRTVNFHQAADPHLLGIAQFIEDDLIGARAVLEGPTGPVSSRHG